MQIKKLKRVVVKEEFVALTGDVTKAIILNQFIYWSERVHDFDKFILEEKSRAEQEGEIINFELTNGWIYKKAEQLSSETMLGLTPGNIRSHIKVLVKNGWLNERKNPKYKWDRTIQYRVNIGNIYNDLLDLGYVLQDYRIDVSFAVSKTPFSKTENGDAETKNHVDNSVNQSNRTSEAIPEITTEITKLLVSKDTNNGELALRASPPVDGLDNNTSKNQKTKGGGVPIYQPTAKELVAELVKEYREIDGVTPQKGDYAFIGSMYNKYGYELVYEAINELLMSVATQDIVKPLMYLKGILNNLCGKVNPDKYSGRANKITGGGKNDCNLSKSKCVGESNFKSRKPGQNLKGQSVHTTDGEGSLCTDIFPEGFDMEECQKDPKAYYARFYPSNR